MTDTHHPGGAIIPLSRRNGSHAQGVGASYISHAASLRGAGLERRGLDQPAGAVECLPLAKLHAEVKLPSPHQQSVDAVPPPSTIELPVTHLTDGLHRPIGVAVNPFAIHHKFLVHGPIVARGLRVFPNHQMAPAWRLILLSTVRFEASEWEVKTVNHGAMGPREGAPDTTSVTITQKTHNACRPP